MPPSSEHSTVKNPRSRFLMDVEVICLDEKCDLIFNGKARLVDATRIEILSLKRLGSKVWLRFPSEPLKFYEALVQEMTHTNVEVTRCTNLNLVEVCVTRSIAAADFAWQVIGHVDCRESAQPADGTSSLQRTHISVA